MRRLICAALAALFVLSGCSNTNMTDPSQTNPGDSEGIEASSEPVLPPSDSPDFYDELYSRNARIVASFDFDDFSVWFAITPIQASDNQNRWDFANGGNKGIPLTVAVVRNSQERYTLVQEIPANLDLRLHEWSFEQMPEELPKMQNHHLKSGDGFMFTNFFDTEVFRDNEGLRRQALMVRTDKTLSLLYQSPMEDLGAAGEYLGGILFGMNAANNRLRHIVLGKEGVIADSAIVTKGDYKSQFYTLDAFHFTPETNTITLGGITANVDGITEVPYEVEFAVSTGGQVSRVDPILGLSAKTLTDMPQGSSITTGAQYPIIGSRIYRFEYMAPHIEPTSQLKYDSFDLHTQTHLTQQLLHDFGSETITRYSYTEIGFRVDTNVAAYFFDDNLAIVKRIPWPVYTSNGEFNASFTLLAFQGEVNATHGMYLYNLETNEPPTLLFADIPWDFDSSEPRGESLFPIRFIGEDRLFVGVSAWESSFFRILDVSGNTLEEFPFHASGMHSGGYNYSNSAMTIFLPMQSQLGTHYYDFNSRTLFPADWWGKDELQSWDYYTPDPVNPHIWYVSSAHFHQPEFPSQVEQSDILRLDFENKTVEPLISISGTRLALLSASKNGELIFAFANDRDNGFAVYSPEEKE